MLARTTISLCGVREWGAGAAAADVQILNDHCDNHRQLTIKLSTIDDVTRMRTWLPMALWGCVGLGVGYIGGLRRRLQSECERSCQFLRLLVTCKFKRVSITSGHCLHLPLSISLPPPTAHKLSLSAGSCTVRMSNEKVIKFKGCNWEHS